MTTTQGRVPDRRCRRIRAQFRWPRAFGVQQPALPGGRARHRGYVALGPARPVSGRLQVANAGFCAPYHSLVRERPADRSDRDARGRGLPRPARWTSSSITMTSCSEPGDSMIFYSPGALGIRPETGEPFGPERVRRVLAHWSRTPTLSFRAFRRRRQSWRSTVHRARRTRRPLSTLCRSISTSLPMPTRCSGSTSRFWRCHGRPPRSRPGSPSRSLRDELRCAGRNRYGPVAM